MTARDEQVGPAYFVQVLNAWNVAPELVRIPGNQLGELWRLAAKHYDRGVGIYGSPDGLLVVGSAVAS